MKTGKVMAKHWFVFGLLVGLGLLTGACTVPTTQTPAAESPTAESLMPTPTAAGVTPTVTPVPTWTPGPEMPTESPTAEPTPAMMVDPLVPVEPATPPPPDFDPTPPPFDPSTDDEVAWARDYVALVTAVLNSPLDLQEALSVLMAWGTPPGEPFAGAADVTWAEAADLDGDGTEEWLISFPMGGQVCGMGYCPAYVVVFELDDGLFQPRHLVRERPLTEVALLGPSLRFVEDITGDGATEVVIEQTWCGAHTCFVGFTIGRWDGTQWHNLTEQPIQQASSDVSFGERDGAMTFQLQGGIIGSVGAGLQRPRTLVFAWDDGLYRLVEEVPEPSDHPYYQMLDANAALAAGDLERALILASQAVAAEEIPELMAPVSPVDGARIVSYAGIEAMLVHALRDDAVAMAAVLAQVQDHPLVTPNVYSEAAETLLATYRETGDAVAACAVMEDAVAAEPDEAVFFQWYGYGTERLTLDQICPLTGPSEGPSPEV